MDKILAVFTVAKVKPKRDDEFTDRLNSRYSVFVLVAFAILVCLTQYVGIPINCWAPVHFTGSHRKFANSYCWVKNTYWLPFDKHIPAAHETYKRDEIPYYQWIPFILLAQGFLFYAPSIIWHGLNQKAGVDADNILESAAQFTNANKEESRQRTLDFIASQMDRFLSNKQHYTTPKGTVKKAISAAKYPFGRRFGSYLVTLYIFTKVVYIANVIFQLFVLNSILSTNFNIFGVEFIQYAINGGSNSSEWIESANSAFPRVTMCDFLVRRLGNVQRYTVQCVLPINLYNEKIYVFLWFWMVFVATLTTISLLVWILRAVLRKDRLTFVRNHLLQRNLLPNDQEMRYSEEFLDNYLRQDGAFLLRLIGHNTNNNTVTDLTCALWAKFRAKKDPPNTELLFLDKEKEALA